MLRNSKSNYCLIAVLFHWITAVFVISQFVLGSYMVSLEYRDPLYNSLPHYHRSIGILFAIFLGIRIAWSSFKPIPAPAPDLRK
jgi:cytochrome b561